MQVEQATFLRIDTSNGYPYLEGARGEYVVSSLLSGLEKGFYELLGFVVLPNEVQLLIIQRNKPTAEVIRYLETELRQHISSEQVIFDTDIYREKVDCNEEIRSRLRWMHSAPVRSRLVTMSDAYPYSSANSRFRDVLKLTSPLM